MTEKGVGIDGEYQAPFSKTAQAPPPEVDWSDLTPEDKIKYAAHFPQGKALLAKEAARVKSAATGAKSKAPAKKHIEESSSGEESADDPAFADLPLKRGKKRTAPAASEDDASPRKRGKRT